MKLEDAFTLAAEILEDVAPVLPLSVSKPVRVVGMLIKDAAKVEHVLTDSGVVQAREQAAGEAANKAAKLAGMREAILVRTNGKLTAYETDTLLEEFARRL